MQFVSFVSQDTKHCREHCKCRSVPTFLGCANVILYIMLIPMEILCCTLFSFNQLWCLLAASALEERSIINVWSQPPTNTVCSERSLLGSKTDMCLLSGLVRSGPVRCVWCVVVAVVVV